MTFHLTCKSVIHPLLNNNNNNTNKKNIFLYKVYKQEILNHLTSAGIPTSFGVVPLSQTEEVILSQLCSKAKQIRAPRHLEKSQHSPVTTELDKTSLPLFHFFHIYKTAKQFLSVSAFSIP